MDQECCEVNLDPVQGESTRGLVTNPDKPLTLTEQWGPWEVLQTMALGEERGGWNSVRRLLEREGAALEALGDEQVTSNVSAFRKRLAEALEYERIHGVRSLLKRDHPVNIAAAEMAKQIAIHRS